MASNKIKLFHNGGMHFSGEVNGHTINIDTDKELGGTNLGPRPKILMLAALAGCTGFDIVSILNKMRVSYSDFSIDVEGNLTETEPSLYDKIALLYTIKVADDDQPKMEKAVKLSKEKYCGVSKMFESFAAISFKINYI